MKRRAAGVGVLDGAVGRAGRAAADGDDDDGAGAGAGTATGRMRSAWKRLRKLATARTVLWWICVGAIVAVQAIVVIVAGGVQMPDAIAGPGRKWGKQARKMVATAGGHAAKAARSVVPLWALGLEAEAERWEAENDDGTAVMLTIFTVLKEQPADAFERAAGNQRVWSDFHTVRVAIRSWVRLPVNILLFADDATCALVSQRILADVDAAAAARRIRCEPFPCLNTQYHAPTYDCVFARARALATTELLMYSNSDIVYFHDVCDVAREVARHFDDFVVVGKRRDLRLPVLLDPLEPGDAAQMQVLVRQEGVLHGKFGIDYFIFRSAYLPDMLPFLVGRVRWDNWLLAQYLRWSHAHSVDATTAILAGHHSLRPLGESATRTGSTHNVNLTLGTVVDPKKVGSIEQTEWIVLDLGPNPLFPPVRQDGWWWSFGSNGEVSHAADADIFPEDLLSAGGVDGDHAGPGPIRRAGGNGTRATGTGHSKSARRSTTAAVDRDRDRRASVSFSHRRAVLASCQQAYGSGNGTTPTIAAFVPAPRHRPQFLVSEHGACSLRCCQLTPLPMDLDAILYASEVDQTVVLVLVDTPTLPVALNWHCHAARVGIRNAIFLALDSAAADALAGAGLRWLHRHAWSATLELAEFARRSDVTATARLAAGVPRSLYAAAAALTYLDMVYNILRKQVAVVVMRPDVFPSLNLLPLLDTDADVQGQRATDAEPQLGAAESGLLKFAATNEGRDIVFRWRATLASQVDDLAARAAANDPLVVGELASGLPFDPAEILNDVVNRRHSKWTQLSTGVIQTRDQLRASAQLGTPVWPLAVDAGVLPAPYEAAQPFNATATAKALGDAGLWLLGRQGVCRRTVFPPMRHQIDADRAHGGGVGTSPTKANDPPRLPTHRAALAPPAATLEPWRLTLIVTVPATASSAVGDAVEIALMALDLGPPPVELAPSVSRWSAVAVVVVLPAADNATAAGASSDAGQRLCTRIQAQWVAGPVRCLPAAPDRDPASLPLWADAWFPRTDLEVGVFVTAPDVLERTSLHTVLRLAAAVASDAPATVAGEIYGLGLVTSLKLVPFAKKPVGLARTGTEAPLLLWRYQRALPSGMAWFGSAYAQFLGWLQEQWPRHLHEGWFPVVPGLKAGAASDPTTWQNRFIAERGCYAVYAGPALDTTLVRSAMAAGTAPAPSTTETGGPVLPPLEQTPLYDIYANRAYSMQHLDGRALVVDPAITPVALPR